ncbi:hypothetical protein CJI48_01620 [Bifidobacteriaceae bacterium GH005]|nr:hypothetical protein CJI48_01620 [Bifidobacteriaceae bacterium GH005]
MYLYLHIKADILKLKYILRPILRLILHPFRPILLVLRPKNKKTSVNFANASAFCRTRPIYRYLRPIMMIAINR